MKKVLSIIFAAVLLLCNLTGCRGGVDKESVTVTLSAVSAQRAVIEEAGAVATRQYIIARLKTEALIEYDLSKIDLKELKAMIDEAAEAWRICESVCVQTDELAGYAQSLKNTTDTQASTISYIAPKSPGSFLTTVAYAAEENAATRWARDLTAKFDSYPSGEKIKELANQLGTDAKNAYAQLQMAQNILESDAYSEQANVEETIEQRLMATKTACKTGLYVGGVIASGGAATGILEAGGMVIGGVDTIVDIASTGSTIILGENNRVTMAANDFKNMVAPVSSISGGFGFNSSNVADKLSYFGDSVLDLVNDGKILGGLITVGVDGETTITMNEISTEGTTPDEVRKELKDAGLPVPEDDDPKTSAELVQEMEEKFNLNEEELNEVIENLRNLLYDMFLEPTEEPTEEPTAEESIETPQATAGGLSIDEIVGTYDVVLTNDEGDTEQTLGSFSKNEYGQLVEGGNVYQYDPVAATATYTLGSSSATATSTLVFTSDNGGIRVTGNFVVEGEHGTTTFYYDGHKVD
jgi:hypothetical protein